MTDWDLAYDNRAHVKDAESTYLTRWQTSASEFRDAMTLRGSCELSLSYGEGARNTYDLFEPVYEAKGTVIFIHGGYWRALDNSWFSHLASGPLAHGWRMAIPSYTLAPQARIREISTEIAKAVTEIGERSEGPIRLIGHSAGGHLVARMLCNDNLLTDETYQRIENTVAVSGVFDLQHLIKTKMNDDLQLDPTEIQAESPVNLLPRKDAKLTCLVGGSELPEFLRQNELLAVWKKQGAKVRTIADHGKNHFSVIEPLSEPSSIITMALLG